MLPGEHSFVGMAENAQNERLLPLSEPHAYLYEPDPAILRAGLVQQLGLELEAAQLDPEIAYLTADARVETPFARSWQVETLDAVRRQAAAGGPAPAWRGAGGGEEAWLTACSRRN